jgi:acetylornithine deacetylase/succinyl-diaminopimelate desuccinylase-like protein
MKSLTAAQLLAFEAVARSGRRPRRSLMLLATSSEETGSDTGTRRILALRPDLVKRMGTVLTEGGVVEATSPTEVKYWGIEFAQKRFAQLSLCSRSRADLEALRALLERDGRSSPRPRLEPAVGAFLAAYGPSRGLGLYRELLAEPAHLPLEMDRYERLTPFLQSLFRDEIVPFRLEPESDGSWRLDLSVHLLPGSDLGAVLAELLPAWTTFGLLSTPPDLRGTDAASPLDSALFRTVERVIAAHAPGVAVGPYFLPWTATDARFFRAAGIPAYGISPFAVMASETTGIAKPDERMQLPAYVQGVGLYRDLVAKLVD